MTGGPGEAARPFLAAPGPPEAWHPRPYQQLLRGPNLRWWRPLVGVLVLLLGVGLDVVALVALAAGVSAATGLDPATALGGGDDPRAGIWLFLLNNLLLAGLIPAVQVATWAAFGWRPRWVASVAGGLRRGWFAACLAIAVGVFAGAFAGLLALGGTYRVVPGPYTAVLVVVVLLTTPLQCAGEEYLFRGWIPQTVGAVIPGARVGALTGGVLASGLFAWAHGQQDLWLFADRLVFGLVASYLVWRTGGLEAGIAVHIANNMVVLLISAADGSFFRSLTETDSDPVSFVVRLAVLLVAVGVVLGVARWRRVRRLFHPPLPVTG